MKNFTNDSRSKIGKRIFNKNNIMWINMVNMLGKYETKGIIRDILLIHISFAIGIYFLINYHVDKVKEELIAQNSAMYGKILTREPSLKGKIEDLILKEADEKEIALGMAALKQYGYDNTALVAYLPIINRLSTNFSSNIFLNIVLGVLPVIFVVVARTRPFFNKVDKYAKISESLSQGVFYPLEIEETNLLVLVKIIDNGEGVDKEDLPHIFKRFYKSPDSQKTASVGIGLSLAKAIIDGNGGNICARSNRGEGAEFEITFMKFVV